jgi:tetratricopeptide (TPR) repeat protein
MRNVAASYKESGDLKNAISHYEKVRKHFPNYVNAQANLIYLYLESNRKEDAKKLFDELIEKFPDNPRLLELRSKFQ